MMEVDPPETEDKKNSILKRKQEAQTLIQKYYFQLTQGCGKSNCSNVDCATCSSAPNLPPNEAAAKALQLFKSRARLCSEEVEGEPMETEQTIPSIPGSSKEDCSTIRKIPEMEPLTESRLESLISECSKTSEWDRLRKTLWDVFSCPELLAKSWPKSESGETGQQRSEGVQETPTVPSYGAVGGPLGVKLSKEQVRALDSEKDIDSSEDPSSEERGEEVAESSLVKSDNPGVTKECTVEVQSLRRSYERLFSLDNSIFEAGLVNALVMLASNLEMDLKCKPNVCRERNFLNLYSIVLELPVLGSESYLENVLPPVCRGVARLPIQSQVCLVRSWSTHSGAMLKGMLENLQQILSLKVYTGTFTREHLLNDDETITSVVSVIRILYYASLLGGEQYSSEAVWDTSELAPSDTDNFASIELTSNSALVRYHDPISSALSLSPLDVKVPLIPLEEFYNEPLNETIEMDRDFAYWKMPDPNMYDKKENKFSFMSHPFILNPATKNQALYYDNRIRMYSERRMNIFQSMFGNPQSSPYLKLQVRRDRIISDSLSELEMVVMENPQDLKKQLMVEFDSEQGIDEGGLSKEFFQLIVEEIFNPIYGMFIHCPESHTYWFNPSSYESSSQYTLIGIVLGLAMYNSVILDLHLPSVIYRKLQGKKGVFDDLKDFKESVWRGLNNLMEYTGDDMEDVFELPFQISYDDLFGTVITTDLKEGGADIKVNQSNKQEYVDLYADFLLNRSVESQFLALQRGFLLVTSESPVHMMFSPGELEMLICGEKECDFKELEASTEYDGGFSKETPCVRWFWEAVHSMSLEDKRKLLQFTTGSDRIPVGGLAKLRLIIAKNGPDSDRLPSAHTCFNVLLLPEYSSKEKMNDLLMKSIKECKGFGML